MNHEGPSASASANPGNALGLSEQLQSVSVFGNSLARNRSSELKHADDTRTVSLRSRLGYHSGDSGGASVALKTRRPKKSQGSVFHFRPRLLQPSLSLGQIWMSRSGLSQVGVRIRPKCCLPSCLKHRFPSYASLGSRTHLCRTS